MNAVPIDLLRLRSATAAYIQVLSAVEPALGQLADVNALREPVYRLLWDEVRAGLREDSEGSPARITRWLAALLGESDR